MMWSAPTGDLLSLDSRAAAPWLDGLAGLSRRHDDEVEAAVGLAERRLDTLRRLGAGEDESGVARALRKRNEVLPRMGSDGNLVDPWDGPGLRLPPDLFEHPSPRDRKHHHPDGAALSLERADLHAERLTKDQLLQRQAGAEAERARAQPADGPRGYFDHRGPVAIHPQLGVHRPIPETQRLGCPCGARGNLGLDGGRKTRRRDVDGPLEERTIQRIRLVEEGEHVEIALHQQSL